MKFAAENKILFERRLLSFNQKCRSAAIKFWSYVSNSISKICLPYYELGCRYLKSVPNRFRLQISPKGLDLERLCK